MIVWKAFETAHYSIRHLSGRDVERLLKPIRVEIVVIVKDLILFFEFFFFFFFTFFFVVDTFLSNSPFMFTNPGFP
jgi:hypothetical protein